MFGSKVDIQQDTIVWSCRGALDSYSASLARADAVSLPPCKTLVVDLTGCVFVDTGGLKIIQEAAGTCGASTVRVRTCDHRIWELLRIAGLDRVFDVEIVEPQDSQSRIRRVRTGRAARTRSYRLSELPRIAPTP